MSELVDRERAEDVFERRVEQAKQVLRELQDVLRNTVAGHDASTIARRLEMSRPKVHYMQRVLKLRDGRLKNGWLATRGEALVELEAR